MAYLAKYPYWLSKDSALHLNGKQFLQSICVANA